MIVGSRLKELRQKRNISADELALAIGISRQQIAKYEADRTDITSDTLIRLATYFHVSTDYLLGLSDDSKSKKSTGHVLNWEIDTRKLLDRVSPETAARLIKSLGLHVTLVNSEIDVLEMLDQFSPALVAKFLSELGIEPKFKNLD